MKTLTKLSKKAEMFCELSGYDVEKVRDAMNGDSFAIQRCESKEDMDYYWVDYDYPYVIYNPFNINIK